VYVCVSAAKDDIAAAMAGGIAFMSLEDMKAELGLSESEYNRQLQDDRMHGGPKGGPDGTLEQRRKDHGKMKYDAAHPHYSFAGMSADDRASKLGLAVAHHEPFWKHGGEKEGEEDDKGVIHFVKRPGRCPQFNPEVKESSMAAGEKTKNHGADVSKKTKVCYFRLELNSSFRA